MIDSEIGFAFMFVWVCCYFDDEGEKKCHRPTGAYNTLDVRDKEEQK